MPARALPCAATGSPTGLFSSSLHRSRSRSTASDSFSDAGGGVPAISPGERGAGGAEEGAVTGGEEEGGGAARRGGESDALLALPFGA